MIQRIDSDATAGTGRGDGPLLGGVVRALLMVALVAMPTAGRAAGELTHAPSLDRDEARRLAPGTLGTEPGRYETPESGRAEPERLSELRQTLAATVEPRAALRVRALKGYLDYDEEDQVVYSPQRTRIQYGPYELEADQLALDTRMQEVQASGDVVLTLGTRVFRAESMRYNFRREEGVAYRVRGQIEPIYFRPGFEDEDPEGEQPQMERLSPQQSIFRDTDVTTCDFNVPHYYIRAREVLLFEGDRIFLRGATFYVWDVPLLYLPFYSRSLVEPSPWFTRFGYGSEVGAFMRLGYAYQHRTEEPSMEDPDRYRTRDAGTARVFADYLSKLGAGGGLQYEYRFGFDRHRGQLDLYGLYDHRREVVGNKLIQRDELFSEAGRWRLRWQHVTDVMEDLRLLVNVDAFSDPDLFYDVLDLFGQRGFERERQVERRGRLALTYHHDAFVARLMADVKDRIGLDRYGNPANPADDNRMFDLDPTRRLEDLEVDGISNNRFGRSSAKLPHARVATRKLPFGAYPLFYEAQLDAYYALDKGLNDVDDADDAFVRGLEAYHDLLHRFRLSPRHTLLTKLGVGVGYAERDEDLGIQYPTGAFPQQIDGLMFTNKDGTFRIGGRERNLDQIEPFYVWGDSEVEWITRFSKKLTGQLGWRLRETTNDFLGDFYASLGDTTFREDLYDYKIRHHWVEGELKYRLAQPTLTAYVRGDWNLESRGSVYSKERLGSAYTGGRWTSAGQSLVAEGRVGWQRRQILDPTDPMAYEEDLAEANIEATYAPLHQRWYTRLSLGYHKALNGELEGRAARERTFFTDEDGGADARLTYGREIGPKWDTEVTVRWDQEVGGLREIGWLLQRDLHDAIGTFEVTMENDEERVEDREDDNLRQVDVRLGLRFKMPGRDVAFGSAELTTIDQQPRRPALAQ